MVKNLNTDTFQTSLQGMMDALFRPVEENGFWSESEGRILRALNVEFEASGGLRWSPDTGEQFRYGPMALMGLAMWRLSSLGDDRYDTKLQRNLVYFREHIKKPETLRQMPSYGVGPLIYAMSRLHELWPDDGFEDAAATAADLALREYAFRNNEDSLVLMGLATRADRLSDEQRSRMQAGAQSLRSIQDEKGLYRAHEYRLGFKHQNQMYTMWGLGHTDMVFGETTSVEGMRRCLQYTIDHRMQADGALLWHHYRDWIHRFHSAIQSMMGRVAEPLRLYSCHQAFFIYAIQVFRQVSGEADAFAAARDNALRWEYGQNVIGEDLFEKSGIGIPMRIMTTSGQLNVPTQRFVGIYEIGAMIMCMVCLLEELNQQASAA